LKLGIVIGFVDEFFSSYGNGSVMACGTYRDSVKFVKSIGRDSYR